MPHLNTHTTSSVAGSLLGFSPRGFSEGKSCVCCGCYSFSGPLYACKYLDLDHISNSYLSKLACKRKN
jgi:hypothetical protein